MGDRYAVQFNVEANTTRSHPFVVVDTLKDRVIAYSATESTANEWAEQLNARTDGGSDSTRGTHMTIWKLVKDVLIHTLMPYRIQWRNPKVLGKQSKRQPTDKL